MAIFDTEKITHEAPKVIVKYLESAPFFRRKIQSEQPQRDTLKFPIPPDSPNKYHQPQSFFAFSFSSCLCAAFLKKSSTQFSAKGTTTNTNNEFKINRGIPAHVSHGTSCNNLTKY